ncbi:hypothetical protein H0H81_002186 [Sphagnurus paluster]|uniref:F-box domain-containing protein n=1 Tax=Sphagnurus paluster TaxID=117069 RepID=A0A9P7GNJ6_9AGAR|nr:hypothetical protein H0H81_002186 [Sphagnurus paluster]
MRVCEEEELETYRLQFSSDAHRDSEKPQIGLTPLTMNRIRMWRIIAFFKSLEGYHAGDLDLTGRHPSRLSHLQTTWNSFIADFLPITVLVKQTVTRQSFEFFPERFFTLREYSFEDQSAWIKFSNTWKIPVDFDFDILLSHTTSTLRAIARNPPMIQKLHLLDLPVEILNEIFEHASLDKARIMSSTRPDLSNAVETLRIRLLGFGIDRDYETSRLENGKFYAPMYRSFIDVLGHVHNLTSLSFLKIFIDLEVVVCICNLTRLQCLDLRVCRVGDAAQKALLASTCSLKSTSIINLHLLGHADIWYILLFCPQIRNLSVKASDEVMIPPQGGGLWSRLRFPQTLERLYLGDIQWWSEDPVPYWRWLEIATRPSLPQLTHLKIHTGPGIPDLYVLRLLRAFRTAPVSVLSLDGLADAQPTLLTSLSTAFPGLIGLTLFRRESNRQRRSRGGARWPYPDWEYAPHMAGFTRLRHFGWNSTYRPFYPSTYVLRQFEEGFIADDDFEGWKAAGDNECFSDGDWTPRMFAIQCLELCTFSYTNWFQVVYVSRTLLGIEVGRKQLGVGRYDRHLWDPSDLDNGWPDVVPQQSCGPIEPSHSASDVI